MCVCNNEKGYMYIYITYIHMYYVRRYIYTVYIYIRQRVAMHDDNATATITKGLECNSATGIPCKEKSERANSCETK